MAAWAGPGPDPEPRRAAFLEQSCGAGEPRGAGAGAAPAGGRDLLGRLPRGQANLGCRRGRVPGGQQSAPGRSGAPPSVLRPRRSSPTKGPAGGGEEEEEGPGPPAARAQSCGVAFPRRRGAGGRSLPRAFSRRGPRRSLRLPKPIGESRGEVPPFWWVISAGGKLPSVWQTWCPRARSSFALGRFCFCFWRNYGAGRLHKSGAFSVCVKILIFLSNLVWFSTLHFKKRRTTELTLAHFSDYCDPAHPEGPSAGSGRGGRQARRAAGHRSRC